MGQKSKKDRQGTGLPTKACFLSLNVLTIKTSFYLNTYMIMLLYCKNLINGIQFSNNDDNTVYYLWDSIWHTKKSTVHMRQPTPCHIKPL